MPKPPTNPQTSAGSDFPDGNQQLLAGEEITLSAERVSVDLFCLERKFLVYNMVSRNLIIKYRRSFFGFFWTLLYPIALAALFYFVFKIILKVQIPHYLVFILSGVLPWAFFSQTVLENLESLVANFSLLTKVPVPIQVFPWVGAVTNGVTLTLAFPIVLLAGLLSAAPLGLSLLALPIFLIALFLMGYSAALISSIAFVYLRDLRHLLGLLMQLWFYATPVVYSEAMIPEPFQWILWANPLGGIFSAFHSCLVSGQWPALSAWVSTAVWTACFLSLAWIVRAYFCDEIVENL